MHNGFRIMVMVLTQIQYYPLAEFDKPQNGTAICAPNIRYRNNKFYIYFGDPDRGVFITKVKNAEGPCEPLKHIKGYGMD